MVKDNLDVSEKQKLKYSQIGLTTSLVLVFIPVIAMLAFKMSDSLAKWLGVALVVMILPTLYFTWNILKLAYKDQKDNPMTPLWVPKVYGFGLSINPYHRFGKLIMWILVIFIIALAIYIALEPAELISH
ncbi:hypothetical protein [Enterococcus sp. DIV0086]|uniref:hypothetical protein n=1 Tax=Enterococcus sp. DIV0086 TaxID=2774655 RepID=UPI003D2B4605